MLTHCVLNITYGPATSVMNMKASTASGSDGNARFKKAHESPYVYYELLCNMIRPAMYYIS